MGLDIRVIVDGERKFSFRAGSYSGYNQWRNQLAGLIGKTDKQVWAENDADEHIQLPFKELIYFSDCEGDIDTATSQKLYKDFGEYMGKASQLDGYFMARYKDWMEAFRIASDGGTVHFC